MTDRTEPTKEQIDAANRVIAWAKASYEWHIVPLAKAEDAPEWALMAEARRALQPSDLSMARRLIESIAGATT